MHRKLSRLTKAGIVLAIVILVGTVALQLKGPKLLKGNLWTEEELRTKITRVDTSKPEEVYLVTEILFQHQKVQEGFNRLLLQLNTMWSTILLLSLIIECLHRTTVRPG
ncbi:MAG: hypothetical protein ACREJJ_07195 [Candidatus Methylomirabilales bacterium]